MDLSQFVAHVYFRRGSFTTFPPRTKETETGKKGGPFDATVVMRSQDPFEDALWGELPGFDNYKDYFGF